MAEVDDLFFRSLNQKHSCDGLIFLETYSTMSGSDLQASLLLPDFLCIVREVTGDPCFSMYNLSLKDDWRLTDHFCNGLTGEPRVSLSSWQLHEKEKKVGTETFAVK